MTSPRTATRRTGRTTTRRATFHRLACALATALALATLSGTRAAAQPMSGTLTFEPVAAFPEFGDVRYVDNCYVEAGVRVSAVGVPCGEPFTFAAYTPDNALGYTGSQALFSTFEPSIDFTPVAGGPFALFSIDLAPLLLAPFGNTATVMFTGFLMGGGSVMQTVTVPGSATGLTTYTFAGFTGLSSVRMTVTEPGFEPYVQFDNVVVGVVPEPATVTLLAVGMVGLAAAARRRRRTR